MCEHSSSAGLVSSVRQKAAPVSALNLRQDRFWVLECLRTCTPFQRFDIKNASVFFRHRTRAKAFTRSKGLL